MPEPQHDIIICGGGVPGLALANLLRRAGIAAAVIEKNPPPALENSVPDARTSALMQGSINILKAGGGAWEACLPYGAELRTLRIVDDSRKPQVTADFPAHEIGLDAFGVNMPNNALRAALSEDISMIAAGFRKYTADDFGVTVTLDNGAELRGRLLIAADGRNSPVRGMAGIACVTRDYGQSAITCLLEHTKSHGHISTEFHRPSGPFTLVPLPGNRSSLVWVDDTENTDKFMAMNKTAFERAVQDRTQGALGKISLSGTPSAWPLSVLSAKSLTAPRVALMAEAAHVIHPLGAQGLNLSLRDAAALAEIITDALRLGLDPGSAAVLSRYERRRRSDIASRVAGTDGLNKLVSNESRFIKTLRRAGLKAVSGFSPLKELAMQQGLAPSDMQSRLAAGKSL